MVQYSMNVNKVHPQSSHIDTAKLNQLEHGVLADYLFEFLHHDVHNPGSLAPQILKLLFEASACGGNFKLIVDSIASTAMAIVEPNETAVTLGHQMPLQGWLQDRVEDLQLDIFCYILSILNL
jgi:hypothetical protein